MSPLLLTRGLLRRGEYDRALRRLRWFAGWGAARNTEGVILLYAGSPKEAELCFRAGSDPAGNLNELGCALTDQGRFEEAERCLQSVLDGDNSRPDAHSSMSDLYLLQGIEPTKALESSERALDCFKASILARRFARYSLAEYWAGKAWALALLGRRGDAEEAIDRALKEADPGFLPVLAGVHWRIGKALLAMESSLKAVEHFRRAKALDPVGKYGTLAATELAAHSVWGEKA